MGRAVWVVVCLALGCSPLHEPSVVGYSAETRFDLPQRAPTRIDVLFVVDTSPSMVEEHAALRAWLPVLASIVDDALDARVGFISTDLECSGELNTCADAPLLTAQRFVAVAPLRDGSRVANFTGSTADALACLMPAETTCGSRRPLDAIERALDPAHGFVREGAYLLVVIVTDQDDCSTTDPSASATPFTCAQSGVLCGGQPLSSTPGVYQDCVAAPGGLLRDPAATLAALQARKGYPGLVHVYLVGGSASPIEVVADKDGPALAPACELATGPMAPAPRLAGLVTGFHAEDWATCRSVSSALDELRYILDWNRLTGCGFTRTTCAGPCLAPDLLDVDVQPSAPGVQLPCTVVETNQHGEPARVIPRCPMADDTTPIPASDERPCWWVDRSDQCQYFSDTWYRIRFEQSAEPYVLGARYQIRCEAE